MNTGIVQVAEVLSPTKARSQHFQLLQPAALLSAAWLLLFLVTAMFWLSYMPSPITGGWRAWDVANQWQIEGTTGGTAAPPPNGLHICLFVVVLDLAVFAYSWAVRRAQQQKEHTRSQLWQVLICTLFMGLVLMLLPVLFSGDIFSYIIYGRISVIYHSNPLIALPSQFPRDMTLPYVYWQNVRSIYGPIWLDVSNGLTLLAEQLGGGIAVYVLLYKSLGLLCHLVNAVLIWVILTRWAPERRLLGVVIYAWNPLALLEFTSSAHNDALTLTLFLCGFWLLSRGWEWLAIIMWAGAIATKYVVVLLVVSWIMQRMFTVPAQLGASWLRTWQRRIGTGLCVQGCSSPFWLRSSRPIGGGHKR